MIVDFSKAISQNQRPVIVFGASGLLGSAIARLNENSVTVTSKDFDARDLVDTKNWFRKYASDIQDSEIHIACGRVACIGGQRNLSMLLDNAKMTMNLLECASEFQYTGRTVYYSSSCVYPKDSDEFREQDMLTGSFEPSNEGYALGKVLGQKICEYLNQSRNNKQFLTIVPPNLWGDNDNWNLETCHVLPALTQKILAAKAQGLAELEIWGEPDTRREFLRSDDVARAARLLVDENYAQDAINVGYGSDIEIDAVVKGLCQRIGYTGTIRYSSNSVGKKRKLLISSNIRTLGWVQKHSYEHMLDYMVEEATRRGLS